MTGRRRTAGRSLWRGSLLLAAWLVLANAASAAPLWWKIDPVHTQVLFHVDHQGYSSASGRVPVTHGWLYMDPDHPEGARVDVTMDLAQVSMGDDAWSQVVRSRQFLHAARHAQARFHGTAGAVDADGHFLVHGELDLHGKRHPLTLDVHLNRIAHDPYRFRRVAGFSARGKLQRSQYGMTRYGEVVGDEVVLRIEAEALQARNNEIPLEIRNGFEE